MKVKSLSELKKYHIPKNVKYLIIYPKGGYYITRYPSKKISYPWTKKRIRHCIGFAVVSSSWRKNTTKYERDGWEQNASSLGSAYHQSKKDMLPPDDVTGRRRDVLMSGFNLCLRSNLLRMSIGLWPVTKPYSEPSNPIFPEIVSAELTPEKDAIDIFIEQFVRSSDDYVLMAIRLFMAHQYIKRRNGQIAAVIYLPKEKRKVGKNCFRIRITHLFCGGKVWGGKDLPIKSFPGGKVIFKADCVAVPKMDEGAIVSPMGNKVIVELPKRELAPEMKRLKKRLTLYTKKTSRAIIRRKIKDGSYKDYYESRKETMRKYRESHKEKFRQWAKDNPEKIKLIRQKWYKRNRKKVLAKLREKRKRLALAKRKVR